MNDFPHVVHMILSAKVVVELAKCALIQTAVLCHPSFVTVDDIKGMFRASNYACFVVCVGLTVACIRVKKPVDETVTECC